MFKRAQFDDVALSEFVQITSWFRSRECLDHSMIEIRTSSGRRENPLGTGMGFDLETGIEWNVSRRLAMSELTADDLRYKHLSRFFVRIPRSNSKWSARFRGGTAQ